MAKIPDKYLYGQCVGSMQVGDTGYIEYSKVKCDWHGDVYVLTHSQLYQTPDEYYCVGIARHLDGYRIDLSNCEPELWHRAYLYFCARCNDWLRIDEVVG